MPRAVYIGGFGNGRETAEATAAAIADHFNYADPDVYTYSDSVKYPRKVRKSLKAAHAFLVSAGAEAVEPGADVKYAAFLNPPLPRTIRRLAKDAVIKTVRMHVPGVGMHEAADIPRVVRYDASALAELAAHPVANFGSLGRISRFDITRTSQALTSLNTPHDVIWTRHDAFYAPTDEELRTLDASEVPYSIVDGEHDEVVLRTASFLNQAFPALKNGA